MTNTAPEPTILTPMPEADITGIISGMDDSIAHRSPFGCCLTVGRDVMSNVIEHVSNIEYVRWLDRAAELHSDAAGYTRMQLLEEGVMWFVARHEIDYLQESHLGDQLAILTWVRDVKRVKAWRDYVIVRISDFSVVCRANTLWVLVDLDDRRPLRLPEEMIRALKPTDTL